MPEWMLVWDWVHTEVWNPEQSCLHASVPEAKPWDWQVWLARSVPSQTSEPSFMLLPHVTGMVQEA
jgi:hypothetical protein